jgi:toxin YoeB
VRILFTETAWEDYLHWQKNDKTALRKINDLSKAIQRDPFSGEGKPEPLRWDLRGCWSRRMSLEHRLVYEIKGDDLIIHSCRYHY